MCDKIYTIDEIKSIAAPIAKQHGVAALYLFGSYARGEATSASDLDFRIEKGELRSRLQFGINSENFQKIIAIFSEPDIIEVRTLKGGLALAISAETLRSLVSISQFSKGQATQVFDRLKNEPQLVVLKNNVPAAILLSPDEFSRLAEIEENYRLLLLAQERLANNNLENARSEADVMKNLGFSEADIDAAEDVEIE